MMSPEKPSKRTDHHATSAAVRLIIQRPHVPDQTPRWEPMPIRDYQRVVANPDNGGEFVIHTGFPMGDPPIDGVDVPAHYPLHAGERITGQYRPSFGSSVVSPVEAREPAEHAHVAWLTTLGLKLEDEHAQERAWREGIEDQMTVIGGRATEQHAFGLPVESQGDEANAEGSSLQGEEIIDVAALEAAKREKRQQQNRERVRRWKMRHPDEWAAYMRAYRSRQKHHVDSDERR